MTKKEFIQQLTLRLVVSHGVDSAVVKAIANADALEAKMPMFFDEPAAPVGAAQQGKRK